MGCQGRQRSKSDKHSEKKNKWDVQEQKSQKCREHILKKKKKLNKNTRKT